MKKHLKFTLTLIWILFSRTFDAYNTYKHTPNLDKEANPIVSLVGISSWTLLLGILGALTLYVCFAFYRSTYHPLDLEPKEKGLTFASFAAYLYLGKPTHWTAMLYRFPKEIKRLHHYFGSFLTPCLVYAGIISTVMWLLIHYSDAYRAIHTAGRVYFFLIAGCIQIIFSMNWSCFKSYQTRFA
jgi:hypothetical protein